MWQTSGGFVKATCCGNSLIVCFASSQHFYFVWLGSFRSEQMSRTWTWPSIGLGTSPSDSRTKMFPLKGFWRALGPSLPCFGFSWQWKQWSLNCENREGGWGSKMHSFGADFSRFRAQCSRFHAFPDRPPNGPDNDFSRFEIDGFRALGVSKESSIAKQDRTRAHQGGHPQRCHLEWSLHRGS